MSCGVLQHIVLAAIVQDLDLEEWRGLRGADAAFQIVVGFGFLCYNTTGPPAR